MPLGSNFDDFLEDEGYRTEVEAVAYERVLIWKLRQLIDERE